MFFATAGIYSPSREVLTQAAGLEVGGSESRRPLAQPARPLESTLDTKGLIPSLFMLQLPLQRRVSLLVLSESAQTLLLQPPLTRGHPATLHLGCMCLMFPKSSA